MAALKVNWGDVEAGAPTLTGLSILDEEWFLFGAKSFFWETTELWGPTPIRRGGL